MDPDLGRLALGLSLDQTQAEGTSLHTKNGLNLWPVTVGTVGKVSCGESATFLRLLQSGGKTYFISGLPNSKYVG